MFTFEIDIEPTLTDEEIAEMASRIGYAVYSMIQADPGEEEWPHEQYPRTARIQVHAHRGADQEIFTDADPQRFVVWSEAPHWYGEGTATPVVRDVYGNLQVWI